MSKSSIRGMSQPIPPPPPGMSYNDLKEKCAVMKQKLEDREERLAEKTKECEEWKLRYLELLENRADKRRTVSVHDGAEPLRRLSEYYEDCQFQAEPTTGAAAMRPRANNTTQDTGR